MVVSEETEIEWRKRYAADRIKNTCFMHVRLSNGKWCTLDNYEYVTNAPKFIVFQRNDLEDEIPAQIIKMLKRNFPSLFQNNEQAVEVIQSDFASPYVPAGLRKLIRKCHAEGPVLLPRQEGMIGWPIPYDPEDVEMPGSEASSGPNATDAGQGKE